METKVGPEFESRWQVLPDASGIIVTIHLPGRSLVRELLSAKELVEAALRKAGKPGYVEVIEERPIRG